MSNVSVSLSLKKNQLCHLSSLHFVQVVLAVGYVLRVVSLKGRETSVDKTLLIERL